MDILVVDDHMAWRKALSISFATLPTIKIIGSVGDGYSALEYCNQSSPDLVILDINMPGMDSFQTAQELLKKNPGLHILGVTAEILPDYQARAKQVGMKAVIPKDMILDYLLPGSANRWVI